MKDYVKHSSSLGHKHDVELVFRYTEAFYKYNKARGISTRQLITKQRTRVTDSADKYAYEFSEEKNTKYEKDVPIWEIYLYELDPIFDEVRFTRHLTSHGDPYFKRRSTWLYPIDGNYEFAIGFSQYIKTTKNTCSMSIIAGCYVRADVFSK